MALLGYLNTTFPAYEGDPPEPGSGIPSAIYGPGGAVEERIEFVDD